ncbi:MAG: hypothetical protein EA379_10390 [Phycisphaerales bacterium]|nr:MAG: hypothetical protein EA379_10390 [Phycisphaerales bacterium]
MSTPRIALAAVMIATLGAPSALAQGEADEALARYLESRELRTLHLQHLERVLERTTPGDRGAIAERLAALYAEALDGAQTTEDRAALERRARALLDLVPEDRSIALRLSLHRATYARAERLAERWRLRLADPAEVEEAERVMRTLAGDLSAVGALANRRVEALERQEEQARELELDILRDALDDARRHRSLAMYLAGWAGCYVAEITAEHGPAKDAAVKFGWVLNADPGRPATIDRVTTTSLRFEHIARAALGAGVAASMRAEHADARRWFDHVESAPELGPALRDELFARRLSAAARANDWASVQRMVDERRAVDERDEARGRDPRRLEPGQARLLGVLAFEARPAPRDTAAADRMRDVAMADLIAHDEPAQAMDLARRYGASPLRADGFTGAYVRAMLAYVRAREGHARSSEHDHDAPSRDPDAIARYTEAVSALRLAVDAHDAERYPRASADARLMLANALHYASGADATPQRSLEAAERFTAIADAEASDHIAADALWMAARALEHAATLGGPERERAERDRERVLRRFVAEHPGDSRAAALLVRRAAGGEMAPQEAIEALLGVSPGSPAYLHAQREAARLLYAAVRASPAAARARNAARFADVAEPLLENDRRAALEGDADAALRATTLARQLLDALLGAEPIDARRAEPALGALHAMRSAGVIEPGAHEQETLYRTVQIALAQGDDDAAESAVASMQRRGSDDDPRFAHAAHRLVYRRAHERWRAGDRSERAARALARHGVRVLLDLNALSGDAPLDAPTLGVLTGVAEAGSWLWREHADEPARDIALRTLRRVLAAQPNSAAHLRAMAELAASAGDDAAALDAWRRILAGSELGQPSWFEARWHVIDILARFDPGAALDAMRAHVGVYPDYGPDPWRARYERLHAALRTKGQAP